MEILIKDFIAVMMSFLSMGKKKNVPQVKINQEAIEIAVEGSKELRKKLIWKRALCTSSSSLSYIRNHEGAMSF